MAEQEKMVVEYKSQGAVDVRLTPKIVINYLVQGKPNLVRPQEIVYFMHVCKARKLNPFIKDCYLIKYDNSPAAIVTSVDYFRKNARKAPDCRGWQAGIAVISNGELNYPEGSLMLPDWELVGGWARAQPEGWTEPKFHPINLATYIKTKSDGTVTSFWKPEKQPDMIMKVAECQLLRQLWGEESTGMYAPEEMPSLEDVKMDGPVQSEIKDRIMTGEKKQDDYTKPIYPGGPEIVFKSRANETEDPINVTDKRSSDATPESKRQATLFAEMDKRRKADKLAREKTAEHKPPETAANEPDPDPTNMTDEEIAEIENTFFMLANTVKIKRADAYDYIEYMVGITGMELVDIMQRVNEDPKVEFEAMSNWLKQRDIKDKPAPKEKTKPFEAADLNFTDPVWEPKLWWKKRTSGFATYVWKNVATLEKEPGPLQQAVQIKWKKFYPDDAFPTSKQKETANAGNGVQTEVNYDDIKDDNGADEQLAETDDDPAPDAGNFRAMNEWFKRNHAEERESARQYLGFVDTPGTLSDDAIKMWNKSISQLIDLNADN